MKSAATALRGAGKALGKSVTYIEDDLDAFKTRLSATANDKANVRKRLKPAVNNRPANVRKGRHPWRPRRDKTAQVILNFLPQVNSSSGATRLGRSTL